MRQRLLVRGAHAARLLAWAVAVIVCAVSAGAAQVPAGDAAADSVLLVGEELIYNVSYLSFDIGQIRLKVLGRETEGGKTLVRVSAQIDSYRGIPFVNLHTVYESRLASGIQATHFMSRSKEDSRWSFISYEFDYGRNTIVVAHGADVTTKHVDRRDTVRIDTLYQDGLSIFYYARSRVLPAHQERVATFVNEKAGSTFLNFLGERTHEEIDAIKYPVDVIHFEGEANFVGVYGVTGGFEGWFSNDAARVPILAKMKVIIGNVRLELMKWTRPGWTPPRAAEH